MTDRHRSFMKSELGADGTGTLPAISRRPLGEEVPARLRTAGLLVLGAGVATGVALATAGNPHASPAGAAVLLRVLIVAALFSAGVYAQTHALHRRMGTLLVATGIYAGLWLLNGSGDSFLFSIGIAFAGLAPIVFAQLMLAHPRGHVSSGSERRLLGGLGATLLISWLALVLTSAHPTLHTPIVHCGGSCPHNALFFGVTLPDALITVLKTALLVSWGGIVGGTAVVLWRRVHAVSGPRGAALLPVAVVAVATAASWATYLLSEAKSESLGSSTGTAYTACAVLIPLAILLGLIFERLSEAPSVQATADIARLQLENVQLRATQLAWTREITASRSRLVEAADAERQRIERDLHDGVQQQVIGLRIRLDLATDAMHDEPEQTARMMSVIARQMDELLGTLRSFARGIYPSVLTDRGLPDALRSAAQRMPMHVSVSTANLGRYDQDVEVAVYFCCLEALQNVAKHAGDHEAATVRLWHDAGRLQFEVTDSGVGFDTGDAQGHGLLNMHDRIEAMGGELSMVSVPGSGTSVRGSMPVA